MSTQIDLATVRFSSLRDNEPYWIENDVGYWQVQDWKSCARLRSCDQAIVDDLSTHLADTEGDWQLTVVYRSSSYGVQVLSAFYSFDHPDETEAQEAVELAAKTYPASQVHGVTTWAEGGWVETVPASQWWCNR